VSLEGNFAAIGSGATIAESVLFQRKQYWQNSVEQTLYNVYEAATLAVGAKAPGVGNEFAISVIEPLANGDTRMRIPKVEYFELLQEQFEISGPKPVGNLPELTEDSFLTEDLVSGDGL
jgi:hypothetical protein